MEVHAEIFRNTACKENPVFIDHMKLIHIEQLRDPLQFLLAVQYTGILFYNIGESIGSCQIILTEALLQVQQLHLIIVNGLRYLSQFVPSGSWHFAPAAPSSILK